MLEQNPAFGYARFTLGPFGDGRRGLRGRTRRLRPARRRGGMGSSLAPMGRPTSRWSSVATARPPRSSTPPSRRPETHSRKAAMLVALAEAELARGESDQARDAARRAVELSQHDRRALPRREGAAPRRRRRRDGRSPTDSTTGSKARPPPWPVCCAASARWRRDACRRPPRAPRGRTGVRHLVRPLPHGPGVPRGRPLPRGDRRARPPRPPQGRDHPTYFFLVDSATLRHYPPALYWLARTQEAMGSRASAIEYYRQYLELRKDADTPDDLAEDARARIAPSQG